jgi:predicted lactoylglutathione lyase
MSTKIFVNLAVKDLGKSMDFFKAVGYTFNQQFTDETAACMVISDDIFAMLITEAKFKEFTPKKIADASTSTEVLTCLSAESKDKVNEIVDKAIQAGATEFKDAQDHGFMFYRSFSDLDGHIWEIMWMNEDHIEK